MNISDYGERKDLVLIVPFMALILGVLIHEGAHIIVALNLGLRVDGFTLSFIGASYVFVDWTSADVTTGELFMLGFIGGLMESLLYAILALRVREMSIMALGQLVYGVAEAFRIALMVYNFLPFELAMWFGLFTMMITVLLICRCRHQEWIGK